jgi:uncharacterized membrane protein
MRISGTMAAASLLLAACGKPAGAPGETANAAGNSAAPPSAPARPTSAARASAPGPVPPSATPQPAAAWDFRTTSEGASLTFAAPKGATLRLLCPAAGRLLVNVPGFRPVGSEERLSVGSGGAVLALVADTRGDAARGGVTGAGAMPADLAALIAGPVSVNYGRQNSGPHTAPPLALARAFAAACAGPAAATRPQASAGPAAAAGACQMQGTQRLRVAPLRAVGTEPFWGARIEGRCVIYSTPDDQAGTRVWTRYVSARGGGTWSGTLNNKPFVLTTRAALGCSDGMSNRRYPIAVDLRVGSERRRGCAAPL